MIVKGIMLQISLLIVSLVLVCAAVAPAADEPVKVHVRNASNPVIPGYFADPSVVEADGTYYVYATVDPWGADTLGCWESADFKEWTYRVLNWPTKKACTSTTSGGSKVWAPSVVAGRDGKFYMYVSVGSEVWAGRADHPLGPWQNALPDNRPLIPGNYRPGYHMIDAEAFIDDDGTPYLYWGSGLNWVNGKCFVVRLKADMTTFDSEVKDVTPPNYFEGPFMIKRGATYYLMYSKGNTTTDTYQVRYATSDNPFGPFAEGKTSPILKSDAAAGVISPGHHAIFRKGDKDFVVFHVASVPKMPRSTLRQICVEPMTIDADGLIAFINPTPAGAESLQALTGATNAGATDKSRDPGQSPVATASSTAGGAWAAERVTDANFATRWMPADGNAGPHWVQLDFGTARAVTRVVLRPEYATRKYRFTVGGSIDGQRWETLADHEKDGMTGSPVSIDVTGAWRYVRVTYATGTKSADASLWELAAE